MENDVLRNKIAPWQEKGRWYHGVFDYSINALIAEQTDQLINELGTALTSGSNGHLYLNTVTSDGKIFKCLQAITNELTAIITNSIADSDATYRYFNTGSHRRIAIGPSPVNTVSGILEFWVFIV